MVSEKEIEELRKEIPQELQDKWVKIQNSFKHEDGCYMDFTELDEILFKIIQFYRKR